MMTIALSPDAETRLKSEADRLGIAAADYAKELIEKDLPARTESTRPGQATIDVLDAWERETATDDPAELARRQEEFEVFKAAMNRNRLEMEGPLARKIYP